MDFYWPIKIWVCDYSSARNSFKGFGGNGPQIHRSTLPYSSLSSPLFTGRLPSSAGLLGRWVRIFVAASASAFSIAWRDLLGSDPMDLFQIVLILGPFVTSTAGMASHKFCHCGFPSHLISLWKAYDRQSTCFYKLVNQIGRLFGLPMDFRKTTFNFTSL